MSTLDEQVLKVAALKVVKEFTATRYDEAREEIAKLMTKGDRKTARSPLGDVKIGSVTLSDPKATASITDLDALTAWLKEHYPEHFVGGYEINATSEQLMRVLFEHAPELLRKVRRVDPKVLKELTTSAAALGSPVGPGGEADVPGITVETPAGVVSCTPDKVAALPAIEELFRAGLLQLDGTVHAALPAAEEPA